MNNDTTNPTTTHALRIITGREARYIMGAARIAGGYVLTHPAAPSIPDPHAADVFLAKLPARFTEGIPVTPSQARAMLDTLRGRTKHKGTPGIMGQIADEAADCLSICESDLTAAANCG